MQLTINPYFASGRSYEDFERDENENNETKKKVKVKKAGKVVGLTYVSVMRRSWPSTVLLKKAELDD